MSKLFHITKFESYDPYATYSNTDNTRFIKLNGEPLDRDDYAISSLFKTGRMAFSSIYKSYPCSRDEFEDDCSCYANFLLGGIPALKQQIGTERFKSIDAISRQPVTLDLDDPDEFDLIRFLLHTWSERVATGSCDKSASSVVADALFLYVLRSIDIALFYYNDLHQVTSRIGADSLAKAFLIESDIEKESEIRREIVTREKEKLIMHEASIVASMQASDILAAAFSIEADISKEMELRRDIGFRGAIKKLERDPKQTEKALVRECWDEWQDKKKRKLDTYKGKTSFAKDMLLKYYNLENQSVIVRWCGIWEKEAEKVHSAS